jgi:acetyltransferase-like isoleucine patch superfamily enzyme
LINFLKSCLDISKNKNNDVNYWGLLFKSTYYHFLGKKIYAHPKTMIRGLPNIESTDPIFIGTSYVGFLNKYDRTYLNIKGKLITKGYVAIGKGCRFDIGKDAVCRLSNCSITGQTNFIITHSAEIGDNSAISWGCEFLDTDFHKIDYSDKKEKDKGIIIGNHVLIGSHVKILKGARIEDNSVVAANSVVTKDFKEKNVLIAGNPARVIKREIWWE